MHRSALCDAFKKVADRLKEFIMHNSGAKQYFSLFTLHFSLFTLHSQGGPHNSQIVLQELTLCLE